jgi:hypothetical protein
MMVAVYSLTSPWSMVSYTPLSEGASTDATVRLPAVMPSPFQGLQRRSSLMPRGAVQSVSVLRAQPSVQTASVLTGVYELKREEEVLHIMTRRIRKLFSMSLGT